MTQNETHEGRCFCGAVEIAVTGAPAGMGYCHCGSCRLWSAGPVNAFTLWKPESVKVTKGAGQIGTFSKSANSFRKWCKACGGHLMTEHPQWGLIDVYAATIPGFKFSPGVHVHYQERVLPVRDGLPKQKDLPKEMGGSNELVAE
ncbi:MAG TPA: GFA family protein [Polyangia bacterium]|nr:GFA family protein [Polyangia bacterium]